MDADLVWPRNNRSLLSFTLALATGIGPADFVRPETLAIEHIFALFWLAKVMLGALVKLVPVLTSRRSESGDAFA